MSSRNPRTYNIFIKRLWIIALLGIVFVTDHAQSQIKNEGKSIADDPLNYEEYFGPNDQETAKNTVFIPIFVRNKEHALPYFLRAIEDLDYDKNLIRIWIVCDHTRDNSVEQIEQWVAAMKSNYSDIQFENVQTSFEYPNQVSDLTWTKERFLRLLSLRQMALEKARSVHSDYIFYTDADNILMNPHTLRILMEKDKTVVAPMLHTIGAFSNYWGAMDENGYYKRTDDYMKIRTNDITGTFEVAMVHSTYLIDLRKSESENIQFLPIRPDYPFNIDDIIVFASHCRLVGIPIHIDNTAMYGYFHAPLESHQTLEEEVETFLKLRMDVLTTPPVGIGLEIKRSIHIPEKKLTPSKLGFDKIFVINLKRRTDRRQRMQTVLDMQGIDYSFVEAVDSQTLDAAFLKRMGIKSYPEYVDSYSNRELNTGEIGCFLSHYNIWKEVVENGYEKVIVLEDDVRFQAGFVRVFQDYMERLKTAMFKWDLIYLGRKKLVQSMYEQWVPNFNFLVNQNYTHWTVGYLLSQSGAKKLIDSEPLGKMMPVDEFIPVMFDRHPEPYYKKFFPKRDLITYSFEPTIIWPTHFTSDVNYVSDTEYTSDISELYQSNEDVRNEGTEKSEL